jgi:protein-L-isoaspartate(D-aspartate) O-methyltransferase
VRERRDYPQSRERMVENEVIGRGVTDLRVIEAMRRVPRHLFVPPAMEHDAYSGSALPIGGGQTISAPNMVALMTEAMEVEPGMKVLEVGTGSGYQAAVLAAIGCRVITVERIPELARRAQRLFEELGLSGIVVKVGDGSTGFKDAGPYDRIVVTAAAPYAPRALLEQLVEGGILVAPVGDRLEQTLMRYTREGDRAREEALVRCVFVPLLGREGFEVDTQ